MKGNENYKKLKGEVKGILPSQILTFVTSLIHTILTLILITDMQKIIDLASNGKNIIEGVKRFIILLIIFFIVCFIQQYILRYTFKLGSNKVMSLLYKKLIDKNIVYYSDKNTGNLNSLIMNDGESVAMWMVSGWLVRILQLTRLMGTLVVMINYSLSLTLIILGIVILCFIGINIIAKKMGKLESEDFKIKGEINQFILESIGNINIIKILRKENYFYDKFDLLVNEKRFNLNKKQAIYLALYMAITITLMMTIPFISVGIGVLLVANGKMTIGVVIAFYALSGQLQEPIRVIAESFSQEKSAMELSNRLAVILDENGIEKGTEKIDKVNEINIDIDRFSYGDKDLLKGVNLDIKSNEITILKGESGSGKSTLGNLILGILELEDGSIKVNNSDIKNIDKDSLWKYILNQGQEHLILAGSLYENLTLGDSYTDEEINKAIKIACLDDFVSEYGLDREFEESGKNLSGGQKQRINLARVLLRKSELLILDEPTSALDNETSNIITKNIVDFSKENNTGLIVISHRDDFDSYADKIVQL